MNENILQEFNDFISDLLNDNFEIGRYMDESDYEDDYSHSDIESAIEELADKIREYLHTNKPNIYLVTTGWCVHVMTPDRARLSRMSEITIEDCLVK